MSSRLQRSAVSFRRQGSSGRIWDDPLKNLDRKGALSSASAAAVAPAADAGVDAPEGPSPRAAPSSSSARLSSRRNGGVSAGDVILESPEAAPGARGQLPTAEDTQRGRPARRRRRISSAFCACMGHPPASHAQQ